MKTTKRLFAFLLAFVMVMSVGTVAVAASEQFSLANNLDAAETEKDTALAVAENYLTGWFADKLSEHYTLYNFNFTFSTAELQDHLFNSFGFLEVDHHLRYKSLDELPYVKGMMDALSINSMQAIVDGNFAELESTTSTTFQNSEETLSSAQTQFLAVELKEQFSAVQEDMKDFNASYFFHIIANFDGTSLSNITVTLEAEDIGYLPAEECLPGTAAELYNDGANTAIKFVEKAAAYTEGNVADILATHTYADYDRIAARDYALKYAANPSESCNCGNLSYNRSASFPDGVTYSKWNNAEYPYFSLFCHNDCADFVSQAMSAGELPEEGTWFRKKSVSTQSWGEAWTSVKNLKNYMTSNSLWTADDFSTCNAGNILLTSSTHVTMITLNNTVSHCFTGHTNDRRNVSFSDKSAYVYYAINLN